MSSTYNIIDKMPSIDSNIENHTHTHKDNSTPTIQSKPRKETVNGRTGFENGFYKSPKPSTSIRKAALKSDCANNKRSRHNNVELEPVRKSASETCRLSYK